MRKVERYFRTLPSSSSLLQWNTKIFRESVFYLQIPIAELQLVCFGLFLNEVTLGTASAAWVLKHTHLFHQNKPGPNAFEDEFIIQSSDSFSWCLDLLPYTTLVFNNYSGCLQSPFTTPCVAHYRQLGFFRYKLLNNYWWEKGHNNRLQKPLQSAFTSWPFIKNHFIPLL